MPRITPAANNRRTLCAVILKYIDLGVIFLFSIIMEITLGVTSNLICFNQFSMPKVNRQITSDRKFFDDFSNKVALIVSIFLFW